MKPSRLVALAGAFAVLAALAGCKEMRHELDIDREKAPYVPSPQGFVDKMLEMAKLGPSDVLYDLGSGDGRIPITAAQRYRIARGVGIDIDPRLVALSNENARKAGVADRVRFIQADVFKADFSDATVITLYLLPSMNLELRPRLLNELKPGTRIVAHRFGLGNWKPDAAVLADERTERPLNYQEDDLTHLFFWVVPAAVEGEWRMAAGGEALPLRLKQDFQEVEGTIRAGGREAAIANGRLTGAEFRFEARVRQNGRTVPLAFAGRVAGDTIGGTLTLDGRQIPATASRVR